MSEHRGPRIANVILRFFQFASAAIVVGIVGWALHSIRAGNGSSNGRLIYVEIVGGLTIVLSLLLGPPLAYVFKAWPMDLFFFILWIVAFALICDIAGTHACTSRWYRSYWGWYWSRLYVRPATVSSSACSSLQAVLAFSAISWILFMFTTIIGICVFTSRRRSNSTSEPYSHQSEESADLRQNSVAGNMNDMAATTQMTMPQESRNDGLQEKN